MCALATYLAWDEIKFGRITSCPHKQRSSTTLVKFKALSMSSNLIFVIQVDGSLDMWFSLLIQNIFVSFLKNIYCIISH